MISKGGVALKLLIGFYAYEEGEIQEYVVLDASSINSNSRGRYIEANHALQYDLYKHSIPQALSHSLRNPKEYAKLHGALGRHLRCYFAQTYVQFFQQPSDKELKAFRYRTV